MIKIRSFFRQKPFDISNLEFLPNKMSEISQGSSYGWSLKQCQDFLKKIMFHQDENCFSACILCFDEIEEIKNVVGFLNVQVIFCDIEIELICVDQNYRHQGIGLMMLNELKNIFSSDSACIKGQSRFFLEVGIQNANAISLYKKFGFQQVSIRKKYYKGIEDALLMGFSLF